MSAVLGEVLGEVIEDKEYVLLLEPLESDPAEKNRSSETLLVDVSDPSLVPLPLPTLGGGVTQTFLLSLDPLEIVMGESSPIGTPAKARPNPRPGRAFLARRTAVVNSSSKSVRELVLRIELLRLGVITRGSPG
jgi:hypothetical protein